MRDIPTKNIGDPLTADEFNDIPAELENTITSTGIVLSAGDLTQLVQSISTYAASGTFYTDSGSSTAYVLGVLGSLVAPPIYSTGMSVSFIAVNTSTTATPTIDVAGLGVKNIVDGSGAALLIGDITTTRVTTLIYDGTDFLYPDALLSRVTLGAVDSGGVGFKLLRVPN